MKKTMATMETARAMRMRRGGGKGVWSTIREAMEGGSAIFLEMSLRGMARRIGRAAKLGKKDGVLA